jgi:chromosome partitioning protein
MLTINALAAVNSIIIPVQAEYLAAKGLEQLLNTVSRIQRHINKSLRICGILLTMVNGRTKESKAITTSIRQAYGNQIRIFTSIPRSIKTSEISKYGGSIYLNAPKSKVAQAYEAVTKEVLEIEK